MRMLLGSLLVLLAFGPLAWGKGEYTGKDLYTVPNPDDKGGIVVHLTTGKAGIARVVAVGRKSKDPYLGALGEAGKTFTFKNLPVDR
jgi:ammonia channel protein AmtB